MQIKPRAFYKLFSMLAALLIGASAVRPGLAVTPSPTVAPPNAITTPGDGARRQYHPETGKLSFIGASYGSTIVLPNTLDAGFVAADPALAALTVYAPEFGLNDPGQELQLKSESTDSTHIKHYQQVYQGLPVIGGELLVNTDSQGRLLSISGEVSPEPSLSITPARSADEARTTALEAVAKWYSVSTADLIVTDPQLSVFDERLLRPSTRPVELVWRLEVHSAGLEPINELVLVNAQTGGISLHFNQIDTALALSTYTASNGTSLPGFFLCDQSLPACNGDAHADAAHKYAADTYNFYNTYHARDSIDNAGMPIVSTVHYRSNYANAFWTGAPENQMVYGDAYGFPLADDVVAHELTHGVTQFESNLFYYYQSGAINEALSDIWGEWMDQTNGAGNDSAGVKWLMGEDVSGLGALRNMSNPPAFGDPDKMTSGLYYGGEGDNGGVHSNSGVANKAAFLITDGGIFNGKTVTGLGITKAAPIFYEVQTNLLTSGSDYADLYNALYQGCLNLVGGAQGITYENCLEVRDATDAVEMNKQPLTGPAPEATICPTGLAVNSTLFFDDLESGAGNWSFGAVSGTSSWTRTTEYAASGLYMLWGNDAYTSSDSFAARNANVLLPAGGQSYLHFKHAFGFENYLTSYYDGGWLEYSTNSGGSWADAGPLFSGGQNYNGSIILGQGNPNAGHQAFIADSRGYVSSRYALSSLAGQNVRFRWRTSTDPSVSDLGWVVDDVRIVTCIGVPSVPVLTSPANAGFVADLTPTLDWIDSAPALDHYQVQLDNDADFSSTVHDTTVTSSPSAFTVPSNLDPVTTYFWRVRAFNTTGQSSDWSAVFSFDTAPAPPPANFPDTANQPQGLRPFFDWDNATGANTYTLQVSTDRNFAGTIVNINLTSSAHLATSDLPRGTSLYWRVRANRVKGSGEWSPVKSFDSPNPPSLPMLLTPIGNVTVSSLKPTLDWTDSLPMPERYEVQIATDINFVNTLGRGLGGVQSQYTPEVQLAAETTYYWRVRALGGASPNGQLLFSDWSATGTFKTP